MNAEFTGRWVRRPGGVMVPVLDEPKPIPKPRKQSDPVGRLAADIVWTDETLSRRHGWSVTKEHNLCPQCLRSEPIYNVPEFDPYPVPSFKG